MAQDLSFSWLVEGEVAGCAGPASSDELAYLKAQGIGALVRLGHPDYDFVMEDAEILGAGFDDCYEPVPDFKAPEQDQINRVVAFMHGALGQGRPVAVSCGAGCGRTGTILACYLVTLGHSAHAALDLVIHKRPCSKEIRDRTPQQVRAISEFERRFRSGEAGL